MLAWSVIFASQVVVGVGRCCGVEDMSEGEYIFKGGKIVYEFRVEKESYRWKKHNDGKNPAAQWKNSPGAQMRMPGVEPGSQAWEACMIPLHYMRLG